MRIRRPAVGALARRSRTTCSMWPTASCACTRASTANSGVQEMQVAKIRGQAPLPGLHTTKDGLEIFPRIMQRSAKLDRRPDTRLSTGVAGLDEMLGGGIPAWDSLLVSGLAGSGKSALGS